MAARASAGVGPGRIVRRRRGHRMKRRELLAYQALGDATLRLRASYRSPSAIRQTRTGLCRHSNRSLFARGNSAGKEFGEARDRGGIFGGIGRFRATETALSRVSRRQSRGKSKTIPAAPGNQNCAGLRGGGCSRDRTGLPGKFPSKREKPGIFARKFPFRSNQAL